MVRMEHRLQISLNRYALSMEDKMATGAFWHATNIMGPLQVELRGDLGNFCRWDPYLICYCLHSVQDTFENVLTGHADVKEVGAVVMLMKCSS